MMNRDRIDKLTFVILNNVISLFGLRMRGDELIYMYRLPKDGCKNIYAMNRTLKGGDFSVVRVTSDLTEVFKFVNLDRDVYEKGFENMFEYASWIMKNCKFMTRLVINSLEYGADYERNKDVELVTDMKKFLSHVKLSHEEIKDNELNPVMLYYNLKEDIVRNFFYTEDLENKFKTIKRTRLFKNELQDKFTGNKVMLWLPEVAWTDKLMNEFVRSFITYMTEGKIELFPDYLVDSETADIRREATWFYYYQFINSEACKRGMS